jgi:hypothetical protein
MTGSLGSPGRRSGSVEGVERLAYCPVNVEMRRDRQRAGQLTVQWREAGAQGQGLDWQE